MPRILPFLTLSLVAPGVFGSSWLKSHKFEPDRIETYKTVDSGDLTLNIFFPESTSPTKPTPTIVLFHGGGFSKGNPDAFYYLCDYLASRGMIAISASYRLNNDNIECLRDAKSAMRYVYQNADKLGIDIEKLAAGGGSAGGCLAAALSTSTLINDKSDDLSVPYQPKALVLFNPVYSSKGTFRAPRELRDDFTPIDNIHSGMPPTLVLFGEEDKFVDVPTMKKFQQKMIDEGVRSELVIYPGAKHSFFDNSPEYVLDTLTQTDRFLESLDFLEGEPTVEKWISEQ